METNTALFIVFVSTILMAAYLYLMSRYLETAFIVAIGIFAGVVLVQKQPKLNVTWGPEPQTLNCYRPGNGKYYEGISDGSVTVDAETKTLNFKAKGPSGILLNYAIPRKGIVCTLKSSITGIYQTW